MRELRTAPLESPGRAPIAWWALTLRAIVGYGFLAHGFAKWSRGPDAFAGLLHALGVPAPDLMAWATILVELLGGVAVLLGAFVWVFSIPMTAILFVAVFMVHLPYGFSSIKLVAVTNGGAQFGPPGYETALLYLACLAALVQGGSGPLSLDRLIAARKHRSRPRQVDIHGPVAAKLSR
jgi:putative oxidoreductase